MSFVEIGALQLVAEMQLDSGKLFDLRKHGVVEQFAVNGVDALSVLAA